MAGRVDTTKEYLQHLFNHQVDDSVTPGALVIGIKGKAADGAYYPILVDTDGAINISAPWDDPVYVDGSVKLQNAAGTIINPATSELIDDIAGAVKGPGSPTIDSYTQKAINLAAGANQSLVSAPGANKQIWVYGMVFSTNVAGTVSFQDEDDTALTGIMQIAATGGMSVAPSGNFAMPLWKVATNKALEVDVVTAELDGILTYAIVSV